MSRRRQWMGIINVSIWNLNLEGTSKEQNTDSTGWRKKKLSRSRVLVLGKAIELLLHINFDINKKFSCREILLFVSSIL